MMKAFDKWRVWILAMRPKTLTAAIVPICVGSGLAGMKNGSVRWFVIIFAFLTALCIQIGTNLVNDALDFQKGADSGTRIGPVRVTQAGLFTMDQVLMAGFLSFALAVLFGIPLIMQGGWVIAFILVISVICGYLYTGGPKPLAYHGLGDLFVLIFFGLVSTVSVYYLQTGFIDALSFLAGTEIGLLATVLIAINNLRDRQEDEKVFKRTLAVRFGVYFARWEISLLLIVPFLLNLLWFGCGYWSVAIFPCMVLPLALKVVKQVWTIPPGVFYNNLLAQAAFVHLAFGLLLTLGFYLS